MGIGYEILFHDDVVFAGFVHPLTFESTRVEGKMKVPRAWEQEYKVYEGDLAIAGWTVRYTDLRRSEGGDLYTDWSVRLFLGTVCVAHQTLVEGRDGGVILKSERPELSIIDGEEIQFHFRICSKFIFSRDYIFNLFATRERDDDEGGGCVDGCSTIILLHRARAIELWRRVRAWMQMWRVAFYWYERTAIHMQAGGALWQRDREAYRDEFVA